jgi:hypothetical protein
VEVFEIKDDGPSGTQLQPFRAMRQCFGGCVSRGFSTRRDSEKTMDGGRRIRTCDLLPVNQPRFPGGFDNLASVHDCLYGRVAVFRPSAGFLEMNIAAGLLKN